MIKLLYKPLSIVFGVLGGIVAGKVFNQVWSSVSDDPQPPAPTVEETSWAKVLPAAALQGAIYAVVRAAIARGGATAFKRNTGVWPGEHQDDDE